MDQSFLHSPYIKLLQSVVSENLFENPERIWKPQSAKNFWLPASFRKWKNPQTLCSKPETKLTVAAEI